MTHPPHRRAAALPLLLPLAFAGCVSQGEPDGARELFDGRTLAGWTTVGGRYDGAARWTVEDGSITGRQGLEREGGLIYTEAPYDDFELELELRIDWPFDSGVFLRMTPDAKGMQVTVDHREGGECGGLYSDGWVLHNPDGWTHFRRAEWNRLRVVCRGQPMLVQAWLNGEPLVEHRLESAEGYARSGLIGLQVHGGEDVPLETRVQFRDLRVRPLDAAE
jgi:hypothetical protein